jgi:tetratricopeptide (TPR) repeat protein
VTIHLSHAIPERQLWAQDYNRSISDALSLQSEIARAVTDEIQLKLTPEERTRLANARPVAPAAQDAFLHGQFFAIKVFNNGSERDVQAAIRYFREALEKDPGYAPAYAWLAGSLLTLGDARWGGGGHSTRQILPEVREATAKALELDPSLADAHIIRAWILLLDRNWSETEKEHRIALKLSPNDAGAHASYANFLVYVGRFDEAREQVNFTIELDPFCRDCRIQLAFAAFFARRYDLAIQEFGNTGNDLGLGAAYAMKKMYPEAIAASQRLAGQSGRQPLVVSTLAWVYGLAGRKREAEKLIAELNQIARHTYVSPTLFVGPYIAVDDKDKALTWLERGDEEQDPWLCFLKVGPAWDPLRSEPRFQALLRRMNFPQ